MFLKRCTVIRFQVLWNMVSAALSLDSDRRRRGPNFDIVIFIFSFRWTSPGCGPSTPEYYFGKNVHKAFRPLQKIKNRILYFAKVSTTSHHLYYYPLDTKFSSIIVVSTSHIYLCHDERTCDLAHVYVSFPPFN